MPDGVEHVRRRHRGVLRRARARDVLRQQRQLPQPRRQARRADPRDDPPRHAAQADGHGPRADRRASAGLGGLLRRCRRWDYSVSANAFTSLQLRARVPDALHDARDRLPAQRRARDRDRRATCARCARSWGSAGARPPCSTRRRTASTATTRRRRSTSRAFADALGPDHVVHGPAALLPRRHPLLRELHDAGRIRDVASHPSIEELCLAADLLVTDYSSIMFDYAVLDRPIVIHAPDWEVYRAQPRHVLRPDDRGPGPRRPHRRRADRAASGAASGGPRPAFRERFCSLEDGGARERVDRRRCSR